MNEQESKTRAEVKEEKVEREAKAHQVRINDQMETLKKVVERLASENVDYGSVGSLGHIEVELTDILDGFRNWIR